MLWTVLVLMRFMIRDWGLGLGLGPRTWTLNLYRAVLDVCSSGASAMSGWMDGECGSSSFVFLGGVDCSAKGSHVFSLAGLGWARNLRHGRLYAALGSDGGLGGRRVWLLVVRPFWWICLLCEGYPMYLLPWTVD